MPYVGAVRVSLLTDEYPMKDLLKVTLFGKASTIFHVLMKLHSFICHELVMLSNFWPYAQMAPHSGKFSPGIKFSHFYHLLNR